MRSRVGPARTSGAGTRPEHRVLEPLDAALAVGAIMFLVGRLGDGALRWAIGGAAAALVVAGPQSRLEPRSRPDAGAGGGPGERPRLGSAAWAAGGV